MFCDPSFPSRASVKNLNRSTRRERRERRELKRLDHPLYLRGEGQLRKKSAVEVRKERSAILRFLRVLL